MKVFVFLLLIFHTIFSNGQSISADDKLHFAAGAVISGATYTIVYSTTKNKKKAFWYSLGSSVLAGVAKEIIDGPIEKEKFDTGEILATSLGGLAASTTISLFTGKNKGEKYKNSAFLTY